MTTSQSGRLRMTVSSTAPIATNTMPSPVSKEPKMARNCSPIRANTAPSSTNRNAAQVAVSVSRTDAGTSMGERYPSTNPVTTTTSTPEVWAASPMRYAANGEIKDNTVITRADVAVRRTQDRHRPSSPPSRMPPTDAQANSPIAGAQALEPAAIAVIATFNVTNDV